MTALLIVAAILLFLFLVGMIRLRFRIEASEDVRLTLSVLFLRFTLFPTKEKQPNPRRFTARAWKRKIRRERRRQERARKKAAKKQQLAEKQKSEHGAGAKKKNKPGIGELLSLLTTLLRGLIVRLGRYLRLDLSHLFLTVATGDAAETAILYGTVSGAVALLAELLDSLVDLRFPPVRETQITPDFTAEKSSADIDIRLSLRVWQILVIAVGAATDFLKNKTHKNKRKG